MNFLDSRFYAIVDRFSNLLILNIFWIVSCIPIVTIGPATSAMYSVVRQWGLHQDTSVIRNYFRYFKENFKTSFLVGIIWMVLAILLYFNFFYLNQDGTAIRYIIMVPLFFTSLLFLTVSTFIFPVIAHYAIDWKEVLKNSLIATIANFPTAVLNLITLAVFGCILYYFPASFLIIFSCAAYINFLLCNRRFQRMEVVSGRVSGK
jgi:uncharacterized membrane protein YesL